MVGLSSISPTLIPNDIPYWLKAYGLTYSHGGTPGQSVTVNYALVENGQNPKGQDYRTLTAGEIANIGNSLNKVSANSGLSFVETTAASADLLIGASSATNETAYGRTWYNVGNAVEAVAYDHPYSSSTGLANNSYIYIHELMHAVGLAHSTVAFGSTLPDVIPATEDDGTTLFGHWSVGWTGELQLFDTAVMQFLYGVDTSLRAGDDTYTPILDAWDYTEPNANVPLLWDGAGYDTIDLSAATGRAFASLAPGFISQVDTTNTGILEAGTFSINYGSTFEKLIGTAFNDRLYGADGNETLVGGRGNDILKGGKGNDVLSGNANNDRLFGGTGRDKLNGDGGQDMLSGQNGRDRLLGGNGRDTLDGGNGRDFLIGGRADDILTGGQGGDVFIYASATLTGADQITDFQDGIDIVRFTGGLAFGDLTITDAGAHTNVNWANGSVQLQNIDHTLVAQADFEFA